MPWTAPATDELIQKPEQWFAPVQDEVVTPVELQVSPYDVMKAAPGYRPMSTFGPIEPAVPPEVAQDALQLAGRAAQFVSQDFPKALGELGMSVLNAPETLRYWGAKAIQPLTGEEPTYNPPFAETSRLLAQPSGPVSGMFTHIVGPEADAALTGLTQELAGQISDLTTGPNIGMLAAPVPGLAAGPEAAALGGKVLASYFTGLIGAELPERGLVALESLGDPNLSPAEKGKAVAQFGGPLALAGLLVRGAAGKAQRGWSGIEPEEFPSAELRVETGKPETPKLATPKLETAPAPPSAMAGDEIVAPAPTETPLETAKPGANVIEPLEHGDSVEATLPSGETVKGTVIGSDPVGNAVVMDEAGKTTVLPEKVSELKSGESVSEGGRYANKIEGAVAGVRGETSGTAPPVATRTPGEISGPARTRPTEETGLPQEVRPPEVLPPKDAKGAKRQRKAQTPASAAAEVKQEIQQVARTEGQRPAKDVKTELVQRLEEAIKAAPKADDVKPKYATTAKGKTYETQPDRRTKVTIEIPGDGIFTIWNTKENLTQILDRAKKISTSPGRRTPSTPTAFANVRPTGDVPPDVWVNSSEPTHMVQTLGFEGNKTVDQPRPGKPIEVKAYPGREFFVTSDGQRFHITEPRTGMSIGTGTSIRDALDAAESHPERLREARPEGHFDDVVEDNLNKVGQRPPPEPIERAQAPQVPEPQPAPVGMGGAVPGRGGTGAVGFPGAPVPAIPPPAPAPGATMIQGGALPVTLGRTAPGSVSVPQIMAAMQNVLKTAGSLAGSIRTGHFFQRALGIWKPHEEVIRMRDADSIPTASHEVAHGIQQLVYGTAKAKGLSFLGSDVRRELIGLGKALYGSRKPVAGYSGEGFAEFVRYWLTTEDAAKVAPKMTKFFEQDFLPAHPEVAKALTDARDMVSIWRAQGGIERARRQLVREPGTFRRIVHSLVKFLGYQSQFESGAPIEALSKAAEKKLGRPLAPSEDPFKLYSWKRGSAGATVERMANEHMLDVWGNPTGPSLREALAPVKGQRNEFLLYVFAKVAEMRWKQGKNPGISLEDAQHIIKTYDKPEFQLAAQKYFKWEDGLLDYLVQADPSMADAVARIRGANDFYAPLARMIDPAKAKAAAAAARSNPLMRMHGSGLPVKDIFDQTFINAARLVNRANRALVTRAIVKLAKIPGLGHIIEEIPKDRVAQKVNIEQIRLQMEDMGVDTSAIPQDQLLQYYSPADAPKGSAPIVSIREAGPNGPVTRWFEVDPRLYEQLEGLQKYSLRSIPHFGALLDLMLGAPSRAFRLGTTGLRPAFSMVTNPTRDFATLLAQTSVNPAKVAAMYPAALAEAFKGGPFKDAFFNLGAHMGQPLGLDIGHTKRVSKELFHGRIMRIVRNPIDHLRELLSIPESAPRIAELRAVADEIGWKPGQPLTPDQAVQLALAAKRVTVDFSAMGDVSRVINEAVPFYNPALQGTRAFLRAFKQHPVRTPLLGLAAFTAPTLINWWRNKDKDWYKALPWREKYLYTNIDDGTNVWRIPRPFEWGNLFMVLPEAIMDSFYRHDPEGAKQAMSHIFSTTNPLDFPVLLKLAKEQWQNRISFWDRPIVPRSEVDLPASEQVGPYTSRLAKAINRAFPDLSPRRIDAAVRGYFGGAGTDFMQLLGLGASRQDRNWEGSDFPMFGVLLRRGGHFNAENQHINDFWDAYLPARARVDAFHYARNQVRQGVRDEKTVREPTGGDLGAAALGEDAGRTIRLLQQTAARTRDAKARGELYREAGRVAKDATDQIKKLAQEP